MPLDRQLAFKYFNAYFQNDPVGRQLQHNKRVALCVPIGGGRFSFVVAISGTSFEPSVSQRTKVAFQAMLQKHHVEKQTMHNPVNCAEAHLWLKLFNRKQLPRHLDVYVAKKQIGKPRAKRDSPCRNCQQWARKEFRSVNRI